MKFKPFQIRWAEKLGIPECPYLIRWCFITPLFSIRLHKWNAADDHRHYHNHPWSFITIILKGGYIDKGLIKDTMLIQGDIAYRKASHYHYVLPQLFPTWTLLITGPKIQRWGFLVKNKFIQPLTYFGKYGHLPCD